MFDFEIDEEQMKELEIFFSSSPKIIEKAIKYARKKVALNVRKLQHEVSEKKYINSKKTLNTKTHKVKNTSKESVISASTKRSHLDNFYVSVSKPKPSKENLKAKVTKNGSPTKLDRVFWAFFKDRRQNIGLWERVGKDRDKIAPIRTISPYAMGKAYEDSHLLHEEELQKIFYEALEEGIQKGL